MEDFKTILEQMLDNEEFNLDDNDAISNKLDYYLVLNNDTMKIDFLYSNHLEDLLNFLLSIDLEKLDKNKKIRFQKLMNLFDWKMIMRVWFCNVEYYDKSKISEHLPMLVNFNKDQYDKIVEMLKPYISKRHIKQLQTIKTILFENDIENSIQDINRFCAEFNNMIEELAYTGLTSEVNSFLIKMKIKKLVNIIASNDDHLKFFIENLTTASKYQLLILIWPYLMTKKPELIENFFRFFSKRKQYNIILKILNPMHFPSLITLYQKVYVGNELAEICNLSQIKVKKDFELAVYFVIDFIMYVVTKNRIIGKIVYEYDNNEQRILLNIYRNKLKTAIEKSIYTHYRIKYDTFVAAHIKYKLNLDEAFKEIKNKYQNIPSEDIEMLKHVYDYFLKD